MPLSSTPNRRKKVDLMETLAPQMLQIPDTLPQDGVAAPFIPQPGININPILFWNEVALEANRISHSNGANEEVGPPLSARALAIVHLAMYDAYARAFHNPAHLPAYLTGLPQPMLDAPANVFAGAAVASAAYTTLSDLFPSQQAFFNIALQLFQALNGPTIYGVVLGNAVATAILAARALDDDADPKGYIPTMARGDHRPDPDNVDPSKPLAQFHAPFYGTKTKPFATQLIHKLDAPPLDTPDYVDALREVRARGIAPELMGTLPAGMSRRTPSETVRGIFWAYDGAVGIGTPPRLYNQIVRRVAIAKGSSVAEMARLFALVNVAMADAGIIVWREKYIHNFWRPVLGIREHDTSMGPMATVGSSSIDPDCDSGWLPLGAPKTNQVGRKNFTPPFPAYPSGHAAFGAAALHMTRLFYGVPPGNRGPDEMFKDQAGNDLTFVSDEFNGMYGSNLGAVRPRHLRSFPGGLWQMIIENGLSRVDLGVHWIFDAFGFSKDANGKLQPNLTPKIGGVPLGLDIAEDIFNGGRMAGLKPSVAAPPSLAARATPEAAAAVDPGAVAERLGRERKRIPYLPD